MAGLKFTGIKELQSALKKNMKMDDVKRAVKQNGAELQVKAQRNAPVDTGTLKRSIGLEHSNGGLTATVEPTAGYAPYVELGTRHMDAQPYLKPAFNKQKEKFERDMKRLTE